MHGLLDRLVGISQEPEEILAAAADHDSSDVRRADRAGKWNRDSTMYLHSVLTTGTLGKTTKKEWQ
jgi:hypothetical protein